jgi:hypothetical protein
MRFLLHGNEISNVTHRIEVLAGTFIGKGGDSSRNTARKNEASS